MRIYISDGMEKVPTELAKHDEDAETVSKQHQELFRAPKDEIKKPETKTSRRRIDYGKIMALHNTGWDNKKIADEMGMTYAAVAMAISTHKKKMKI